MGLKVTRRPGESVLIGDDIKITVCRSPKGRLELDIDAPLLVRILRAEVVDGSRGLTHTRRRVAV